MTAAFALSFGGAADASAQMTTPTQIQAGHKGLVGLGLVGAELGLVIPTSAGLDDTWALIVFPVIGATGGALAGHFGIDKNNQEELAVAALGLGLGFMVPAALLTSRGVRRARVPDVDEDDDASNDSANVRDLMQPGLIRLHRGGVAFGMPAVAVQPILTQREAWMTGGPQGTEVHVPFVSARF